MDKDYVEINNYIINNSDMIIINGLLKYKSNRVNKRLLNKIIKKLDNYHINYQIDNNIKIFINNKYNYYKDKFIKELKLKKDKDIICTYLQNNILRKNIKYLLKEIEIIIDG